MHPSTGRFKYLLRLYCVTVFSSIFLTFPFLTNTAQADTGEHSSIAWNEISPLPDRLGYGGPFSGVSNGALVVAGGANFDEATWGTGVKSWHDGIFVLESPSGDWKTGWRLPAPRAYGVSITTPYGVLCIGGSDAERAYSDVLLLTWRDGGVTITRLPDIPAPRAAACGAMIGNTVYVACGQTESAETEVTQSLWAIDLPAGSGDIGDLSHLSWRALEPMPGTPRSQAAAAVQNGKLFVISGFTLTENADGAITRNYLSDAYCFDPKSGWSRIADLPRPAVAAPSVGYGDSHVFVFGGHDGKNADLVDSLKADWPGFNRSVLAYHTITDTWTTIGTIPQSAVTTNAVPWNGRIVIPSGEIRPRIRTNAVIEAEVIGHKKSFGMLNITVLSLYLFSLVLMGFYFSKREKSTADFFIGGRRIPWWAVGLSIFGTQLSSISFMAVPAKVYATDWTYFVGYVCIVLVQPIVIHFYLPFFRRLNLTSAYDYLERRFNTPVRLLGSLSFILFQTGRMTIVLFLPALALSAVSGIDIVFCIIVMGALATFYTVLGGIEAVVWTDVLQTIVLIGGGILSLVIMISRIDGGFGGMIGMGMEQGKFRIADFGWDYAAPVFWIILVGGIFQNMVSYSADQAVIQRYLTTKDEKTAARAIWVNGVMILPVACIWFTIGSALYAFYKSYPALLDPNIVTDQIFPLFIAQQLPDGIVGLVIAGLFAASMSTVDSSLNSVSTVIVTDFYCRFNKHASDVSCLRLARWLTLILGVTATGVALWMASSDNLMSLWDIYLAVLGLVMGSLTGLFALGIFTERTHSTGALAGAIGGALVLYYVQHYTALHFYIYAGVGIVSCFVIGYLTSLILPGDRKSIKGLTLSTIGALRTDATEKTEET